MPKYSLGELDFLHNRVGLLSEWLKSDVRRALIIQEEASTKVDFNIDPPEPNAEQVRFLLKEKPNRMGIHGVERALSDFIESVPFDVPVTKEMLDNVVEEWQMNIEGQDVSVEEASRIIQQGIVESFMDKACRVVRAYINQHLDKSDPPVEFDVYVVWFSKTLKNWKAMVSTSLNDQRYYEVTYNGERRETYLDVYQKWDNVCIPDEV